MRKPCHSDGGQGDIRLLQSLSVVQMPLTLKLVLVSNCLMASVVAGIMAVGRTSQAPVALKLLHEEVLFTPGIEELLERSYVCTMRGSTLPSLGNYATEVCSRQGRVGVLAFVEVYFKRGIHCGTLLVPLPNTIRVGDLVLLWGNTQQHEGDAPGWWVEYGTPVYTPYYLNYERFVRHIRLTGQVPC
jgi:hypothetical protein